MDKSELVKSYVFKRRKCQKQTNNEKFINRKPKQQKQYEKLLQPQTINNRQLPEQQQQQQQPLPPQCTNKQQGQNREDYEAYKDLLAREVTLKATTTTINITLKPMNAKEVDAKTITTTRKAATIGERIRETQTYLQVNCIEKFMRQTRQNVANILLSLPYPMIVLANIITKSATTTTTTSSSSTTTTTTTIAAKALSQTKGTAFSVAAAAATATKMFPWLSAIFLLAVVFCEIATTATIINPTKMATAIANDGTAVVSSNGPLDRTTTTTTKSRRDNGFKSALEFARNSTTKRTTTKAIDTEEEEEEAPNNSPRHSVARYEKHISDTTGIIRNNYNNNNANTDSNNNNVPNSSEQQLLKLFKFAQYKYKQQQFQLLQQQQQQQLLQQRYKPQYHHLNHHHLKQQKQLLLHHHRQRDISMREIGQIDIKNNDDDGADNNDEENAVDEGETDQIDEIPPAALKLSSAGATTTSATGVSLTKAIAATNTSTSSSATTTTTTETNKCEPKILEEVPPEPFYDFSDLAEDAAHQLAEFLTMRFGDSGPPSVQSINDQLKDELRKRANEIVGSALNDDDSLLAFALAAPTVDTVVVKFRDNVTIPPEQQHNKSSFLAFYWRELSIAWNNSDGTQEWGAPFRDCNVLQGRWLWPFRLSFVESKFKIVIVVFIAADEDVCNDGLEEIFGRRHGCDRNTTFCLLTEVKPSSPRDSYTCICRESYYLPNSELQGFPGDVVELSEDFDNYSCFPCPSGCSSCDQNGVCLFGEPKELVSMENLLRVSIGSVLGACILCCVVLGVIVFRQRKSKAIASGMWTVLETILSGIVLLYASVAVHFFPASTERCLLEPWLRELGFITCYGAIILKLYRHLVDFRTRKAHRWVLRDVDLLKYLSTMIFAVICYMAAFTASSLDLIDTAQLEDLREMRTNTCHPLKWELVTQASEILILCFGLHLAFISRNANTQFRERQFLVASLILEFLVSSVYYILRFIYLLELSPGAILVGLFLRSQLTNTISLGLIFVPKLWYQHKQVRSLAHDLSIRLPVDAFKGSHDLGRHLGGGGGAGGGGGGYAGLCLGDPDIGELTISEMSPEDIRAELKRLYTQLEILKNKTLRQDNPHISKRRGGRKAGHRRFSLQALSSKHRGNKHHQDLEITEAEPSRTPEDSVCSAEGPTDAYAETIASYGK